MNILVICQYYYPEPFRISNICEELVAWGHSVTVVTGTPNYPIGEIYSGYENGKRSDEIINGVKVHRCPSIPRRSGIFNRVKNYFSYASVSKKYVRTLDDSFEVVFVNQLSPVMMAEAGLEYKKKYGKKLILYCLDLWPESLCIGGVKRGSQVYNVFKKISGRIYKNADEILVTSRSFCDYIKSMFGISEEKIAYLPQYAESQFLGLELKERTEEFNLMFAGNIGTAQSIDTIIDAAELLKDEKIKFHIVGDGVELDRLKKRASELKNVIFYGRKPFEEMPRYYNMADAMVVTLVSDPTISLTLPGKVQTYMAAGKPIVGAINGETAIVLNEAQGGYCGEAENAEMLAENVMKLIRSGEANMIGQRNREYYLDKFDKAKFIFRLCEVLNKNVR